MFEFITAEGLLEISKTGPGMICWGSFGSDAPEIEEFLLLIAGVEDKLDGKNTGSVKSAALIGLSALEVVPGGFIIEY